MVCNFFVFYFRICLTKTSIGMRLVSCVPPAASLLWTSNSGLDRIASIVDAATMKSSRLVAMDAVRFSVLVSTKNKLVENQ